MTLAGDAGMHGAPLPQGVPEKPIVTEFAVFSWGRRKAGECLAVLVLHPRPPHLPTPSLTSLSWGAVGADHLPAARHLGAG